MAAARTEDGWQWTWVQRVLRRASASRQAQGFRDLQQRRYHRVLGFSEPEMAASVTVSSLPLVALPFRLSFALGWRGSVSRQYISRIKNLGETYNIPADIDTDTLTKLTSRYPGAPPT